MPTKSDKNDKCQPVVLNLGDLQADYQKCIKELNKNKVIERIWSRDYSVWKPDPLEISNRLGWLDIAPRMKKVLPRLDRLINTLRGENFRRAVLLGMGGSSLAPEVLRRTFGVRDGFIDLLILDSTDPGRVHTLLNQLNLTETIFIISTKSGGTSETLSFFKFFFQQVISVVGESKAGSHFIAITDPGSKLEEIALKHNFREIFLNDATIGGRYSALSFFGLVPAALLGVDLEKLLDRAIASTENYMSQAGDTNGENACAELGTILGAGARTGLDKATFFLSQEIESFGDWVEQLIAESTGKEGKGILPVVGEAIASPAAYSSDRLFIHLKLGGDLSLENKKNALISEGRPVITLCLRDRYDLGSQFFLWEMATAIAAYFLGINPFDQPNVESAKILTCQMLTDYQHDGQLAKPSPTIYKEGISVYGGSPADSPEAALRIFLDQADLGSYTAIQAYLEPSANTDASLNAFRKAVGEKTRMATTLGYGPRFLHSTGQLHKGDAGRGLFIQLTAQMPNDMAIPDEVNAADSSTTFGVLKTAQVLGDYQALLDNGRKVIRFDMGTDISENLAKLTKSLARKLMKG